MSWMMEDDDEKITFGDKDERNSSLNSLKRLMQVNSHMMEIKKSRIFSEEKKSRLNDGFSSTESFFKRTDSPSTEKIREKIEFYKDQKIEEVEESQFMSIMKKVCFEESPASSMKQSKCFSDMYNPSHSLSIIEAFQGLKTLPRQGNPKKIFLFSSRKGAIKKNSRKLRRCCGKREEASKADKKNNIFQKNSKENFLKNRPMKRVKMVLPIRNRSSRDSKLEFYGVSNLTTIFKSFPKSKPENPSSSNCIQLDEFSIPLTDQSAMYHTESLSSIKNSDPLMLEPEMSKLPTKANKLKFTIEKLRSRKFVAASENNFQKNLGLSGLFQSIDNKRSAEKLKKSFKRFGKKSSLDKGGTLALKIKRKLKKNVKRSLSRSNSISKNSFLKKGKENLNFNFSSRSRSPYSFGRFRKFDVFREKESDFGMMRSKLSFKRKDSLKERLSRLKDYFNS